LIRRLRQLQRAYYASPKDSAIIVEYVDALRKARGVVKPGRALHAGAGGHYIDNWINIDFLGTGPIDAAADLSQSIPIRDGALDYIHSEDFIEHIDLAAGKRFIAEAYRVLKRGGVMRVLTPDLRALIERVYIDRDPHHIRWCADALDSEGPCESLNMHLRMNGDHRFIYDEELLTRLLREAGFKVRPVRWNRSKDPALRFLDLRDFGLNLFLEAVK
jgi:predicted SAM-dependent methyltransferase